MNIKDQSQVNHYYIGRNVAETNTAYDPSYSVTFHTMSATKANDWTVLEDQLAYAEGYISGLHAYTAKAIANKSVQDANAMAAK